MENSVQTMEAGKALFYVKIGSPKYSKGKWVESG